MLYRFVWAAAIVLAAGGVADGAVLVQYTFPGDPGSLAPTTTGAGLTASNVNFSGSAGSQHTGIGGLFIFNAPSGATSAAAAVSLNSYFQLTATPAGGQLLDLTSLTVDAAYGVVSGFAVRSSVDGYGANIYDAPVTNGFNSGMFPYSVNLSGAAFQDLTGPITIRLYPYYTTGNSLNNPILAFDNLTLNGSVEAVPEPGTWMIVGLGLAAVGLRRLRR